jgi:poly [ADP-ribose] polymerase
MIQEIRDASVQFMKKYYTVKAQDVTQKMIDEAYVIIQQLKNNTTNTYRFNNQLEDLFNKVPRKMNKVSEYIAKDESDFDKIIEREEELLDSLEKIVQSQKSDVKNNQKATSNKTILEANDLVIRPVTFEEEDYILQKLKEKTSQGRSNEDNYIRAYRVDNKQTEKAFKAFCKDNKLKTHKGTHFYFHGTKFENLWSIFKTGLTVNPKAATTGKAFGNGIYFAEQSEKSLGYTNIAGKSKWGVSGNRNTSYLLMYEVATGKSEIAHSCHRYTLKEITAEGC